MKAASRNREHNIRTEMLSEEQTAEMLGISLANVKKLENQEVLHPIQFIGKKSYFSALDIGKIKYSKRNTLSEAAKEVGQQIQRDVVSSLSLIQKILLLAGFGIVSYFVLVVIFAFLFILFPWQTADWLGYIQRIQSPLSLSSEDPNNNVLAAAIKNDTQKPPSIMQMVFKPISKTSLNIVKYTNQQAYDEMKKITILDVNEIMGLDEMGSIIPLQPVQFSKSEFLKVSDPGLIENLNSQFLQGKKPGTEVGDIAIVGTDTVTTTNIVNITNLTNSNLSGNAEITNANLANSAITINTASPLSGGGVVSLGDSLTLTCPTCGSGTNEQLIIAAGKTLTINNSLSFSGTDGTIFTFPSNSDAVVALTTAQTLTNKTINAGSNTILGLSTSNFSSANISQWTNNAGFITASTSDSLTNKTITATSNTISGLTNSNLSGSANITNANLANSSVTINTSTGLSGGASISLGGNITLSNTGVTSLVGTTNQVNLSASTGTVILSLPQDIAATSSPTFSSLTLTSNSNQLVLGTSNLGTVTWSPSTSRTLTFPDATDTVVGKATIDTLTNKTLTSPTLNGTVATSGLTMPAFTASGSIVGSGSPNISSFGTINGLTLTATTDGFTLLGGTTTRTLTVIGQDITIGSTIKPTTSSVLAIQSNSTNPLFIDTGGNASINIGSTSASVINIGRSGVTTIVNGSASANTLTIGNGSVISRHLSAINTFDAANIAVLSCSDIGTVIVTGAAVGDTVVASPTPINGGIETLTLTWNSYVSSTNTVTIRACNAGSILGQNPANQTWRVDVWQH